ncbi:MAG: tRNA (adenosine(37)-N6)-threonylcarbamoyltransferase complex transferase subunit TsaD [Bacteroidia bacterium]
MKKTNTYILAIESSCDDTSCAVLCNDKVLSNITATQHIHQQHGGVVPELASRDHQKNILLTVKSALKTANIELSQLNAIAVTQGPGLMGSLLVGISFAKSLALSLQIPIIPVNHMQGHILAHLINDGNNEIPKFPFLCLTVSGGHTQLVNVKSALNIEIIGSTIDDAVGEAFDKAAKIMGLPYPGGPLIDKHAQKGNPNKFKFANAKLEGYNFSFSGIKTSFLYFINDNLKQDKSFVTNNLQDICASYQKHLINTLLNQVKKIIVDKGYKNIAIAGGVSANSCLRADLKALENEFDVKTFVPKFEYCTDNAAMIGIVAYFKYLQNNFSDFDFVPITRM